jgi:hypothetical protein
MAGLTQKQMEREEWNRLFDYNTTKELRNELQWKQKYQHINEVMDKKNQNYLQHMQRQTSEGRDPAMNRSSNFASTQVSPNINAISNGQEGWNNKFFRIQDNLVKQRDNMHYDAFHQNANDINDKFRIKDFMSMEK